MNQNKKRLRLFLCGCALLTLTSCHSREDWSDIFMKKGAFYAAKGKYDAAISEFEKSTRINPRNQRAHIQRAETYRKMGNEGMVVESLNMAENISLENIPGELYALKGEIMMKRKQWPSARDAYELAVRQEPLNAYYQARYEEIRKIAQEYQRRMKLLDENPGFTLEELTATADSKP